MVNYFERIIRIVPVIAAMSVILSACSSDEPFEYASEAPDAEGWKEATLNFTPLFDQPDSRAEDGTAYEIEDGDMLCIKFPKTEVCKGAKGVARYKAATQHWSLSYQGDLSACKNLECEVYFIGHNPQYDEENGVITFDWESPIYDCQNGFYDYEDGTVNINATLAPKFYRIRFQGEQESSVQFNCKVCKSFNITNFGYSISEPTTKTINVASSSDGFYSPYYYVHGFCSTYRNKYGYDIKIKSGDYVFAKPVKLGKNILVKLPTLADTKDWTVEPYQEQSISKVTILPLNHPQLTWLDPFSQRFQCNTGIHVSFNYVINSVEAYDASGFCNFVKTASYNRIGEERNYKISGWTSNQESNYVGSVKSDRIWHIFYIDPHDGPLEEGTFDYSSQMSYSLYFYRWYITAEITNLTISNF